MEINSNQFKKSDFDEMSNKENIDVKKFTIENQDDDKLLKKELIYWNEKEREPDLDSYTVSPIKKNIKL